MTSRPHFHPGGVNAFPPRLFSLLVFWVNWDFNVKGRGREQNRKERADRWRVGPPFTEASISRAPALITHTPLRLPLSCLISKEHPGKKKEKNTSNTRSKEEGRDKDHVSALPYIPGPLSRRYVTPALVFDWSSVGVAAVKKNHRGRVLNPAVTHH